MKLQNIAASLVLLLGATSALAQDGKPTKEQTIDYIQSNYPNRVPYSAARDSGAMKTLYSGKITDLAVRIDGSKSRLICAPAAAADSR